QIQPLAGEVRRERLGPFVREHPMDLRLEHGRRVERVLRGEIEQLAVGDAAPEEERQARRELAIADAVHGRRRETGRILLDVETELRARENALQRFLDAALEAPCL